MRGCNSHSGLHERHPARDVFCFRGILLKIMAEKSKKYLLIIDGNALLHRAWHAIPPLTTKSGQVVHGAYGFIMILLGAIKKFQPAYIAVTFDLAGKTFRHEEYEAYKATREKKPDELYAQIPVIERILAA